MGTLFARRVLWRFDRFSSLQWLGVVGISLGLGIYVLVISTLPKSWMPLFAVAVLCPFIAIVVGNLRKTLLSIIILDIPLQIDVHLAYRADAANLGGLVGYNVSITTFALVALYSLWLVELLSRREPGSRRWIRAALPLGLYVLLTAGSIVVAADAELGLFEVSLLVQLLLLYIYVISSVRTREDLAFIFTMLIVGFALESLIIIALRVTGRNIDFSGFTTAVDVSYVESSRVGGTLGSPNAAGAYLGLMLACSLAFMFTPIRGFSRLLAVTGFGLGTVALIITLSRGAWVATAFSLGIVCYFAWRRGWMSLLVPLILVGLTGLAFLFYRDAILDRLLLGGGDLSAGRIVLMQLAWQMIRDHPILGVGSNNFFIAMKPYLTPDFNGDWIYTVHNKYLLVWAEAGIGALGAFLWFLLATIREGWKNWTSSNRFLSPLALGLTAAVAGQLVYMLVDPYHSRPSVQSLVFIAGLITAMSQMKELGEDAIAAPSRNP
jgi:putative inorganic carbon (HCO3(-)) transporter